MKEYIFNRNDFKWAEEFYDIIQKEMKLPEWFGKNADALWDMLTGFVETPCHITFIGFDKKENKYNQEVLTNILNCFKDAANEFPNKFQISFE